MIVVRAFPEHPPPGRPHIVDGWPRVPVDQYDYRRLSEVHDDVISMDWDTACSREDVVAFAERAGEEPGRVLVAPCRMYRVGPQARLGQWNLARLDPDRGEVVVGDGEPAEIFGFGMVYLPQKLIGGFIEAADQFDPRMTDTFFSWWHHANVERFVRVAWDIRPVHLHYGEAERGAL